MPIHAIHHFNIRASRRELAVLRDFYCNVVGLESGARPPFRAAGFWLYADGVPILHLTEAPETQLLPPVRDRRSAADHIAFRASDLQATLTKLHEHGIACTVDTVPELHEVQVLFQDPSGVGVELNFNSRVEQSPTAKESVGTA